MLQDPESSGWDPEILLIMQYASKKTLYVKQQHFPVVLAGKIQTSSAAEPLCCQAPSAAPGSAVFPRSSGPGCPAQPSPAAARLGSLGSQHQERAGAEGAASIAGAALRLPSSQELHL